MKRSKPMNRKAGILYVAAFLVMISIPALTMNHQKDAISGIDNRMLSDFPSIGTEGFARGVESYISDRTGGREEMINAYTTLNDRLFHEMVHPSYTYGQDGYVFFKMHQNIPFHDYHREFASMVRRLQDYCESRNVKFYFLFDPEKNSVYRRYLPEGVFYENEWVNSLMNEFDRLGVSYVDNSMYLQKISEKHQVFNRQYDAGHWNDLGCFYGMNHLFARMKEDLPAVRELSFDDFTIGTQVMESLPVSRFPIQEEVPQFTLKSQYKDLSGEVAQELRVHSQYPHVHYYINEAKDSENLPRTLIFQGSYLNSRPQFLISNTSVDIGVHNYQNVLDLDYYFNIFQPETVIFEAAEYVFSDTYFSLEGMKNMDLSPALITREELEKADGSMEEAVKALCRKTDRYPLSMSGVIREGRQIDTVFTGTIPQGCRYAYLYTHGQVYDLKPDEAGVYAVSVEHGRITPDPDARLFVRNEDGTDYYVPLAIREPSVMLTDQIQATAGVQQRDGGYEFRTTLRDNQFSHLLFQLYDPATDTYPHAFATADAPGTVTDTYVHDLKSGRYRISVRANSNLSDEMISYDVYLEEGERYYAGYKITSFSGTEIRAEGIWMIH